MQPVDLGLLEAIETTTDKIKIISITLMPTAIFLARNLLRLGWSLICHQL
jgi:hypothetical protein